METLIALSLANYSTGLREEGTQQATEALEIAERLGDTVAQARCLISLATLLCSDTQLDAAEEVASHAMNLLPERGQEFYICEFHQVLGLIYRSKGETEKAIHHFETVIRIATPFNWHDPLLLTHLSLALVFRDEDRLDDAQAHVERAKLHVVNNPYYLGHATEEQATIWYKQHKLEEARIEALRAADIFDNLGSAGDAERCRKLLGDIEEGLNGPVSPGQPDFNRELL